jgi:hypothetical protein
MDETLRGTGNLLLDGTVVLANVKYVVRSQHRGLMRNVSGRIEVDPLGDGMRLMMLGIGPNSEMVLLLEDGRRWRCALKNNSGDLLNAGQGFESASLS